MLYGSSGMSSEEKEILRSAAEAIMKRFVSNAAASRGTSK
jgi:hypothetical protein